MNTSSIEAGQAPSRSESARDDRAGHAGQTRPRAAVQRTPDAMTPRALARKKRRRRNRFLLLAFVVAATVTNLVFWVLLGAAVGHFRRRFTYELGHARTQPA